MRTLTVFVLFATLIVGAQIAEAQSPKIAVINFDRVLSKSAAGKRASAKFEKKLKQKQAKLDKQQKALKKRVADFQKQASILKPQVRAKREAELQRSMMELQQTYGKLEQELAKSRDDLIRGLLKQAEPLLKDIAKKRGFDMILDAAAVVWMKPTFDISNEVIKKLK